MKSLCKAFIVGCTLLLAASPAWADTLSLSADVPVSYAFSASNLNTDKASGVIFGVSLPFLVGIGAESYKVTGTDKSTSSKLTSQVTMADLYVDLPVPFVNIRVGGGLGKSDYASPTGTSNYDTAILHQVFVNVGWPFAEVFDVHLGFHNVTGNAKLTGTNTNQPVGGKMYTLGLKVGF